MTGNDGKKTDKPDDKGAEGERIAKVMARAGLCSRRDAEAWIADGRVSVNGKKLQSPAINVHPYDDVRVDGKPLPDAEKTRLFRYHKPRGLVTTAKDPEGRPTVFENLPKDLPRVISIGRLDLNSEGLLLLTNDGELARKLELPATGWVRRYRVRVNGRIDPASLVRLAEGIEVEGVRYGAIEAILDRQQGGNAWLTMSLTEGKNREIRKVCAFFGWTVSRLIRLSYGPFQLGHLERGEIEEVPGKVLRDQIGQPGAPQPLRPQQGSGGKCRPPKPRGDEPRRPSRDKADARPSRDDKPAGRSYDPRGKEGKREDRRGLDSQTDRRTDGAPRDRGQADRGHRAGKHRSDETPRYDRPGTAQRGEEQRRDGSRSKSGPQRNRPGPERDHRDARPVRFARDESTGPAGREDARRSSEKQSRKAAPHAARQDKYKAKGGKPARTKRQDEEAPKPGQGRPDRPSDAPRRSRATEIEAAPQKTSRLTLSGGKPGGSKRGDGRPQKPTRNAGSRKDAHRQRRP
jgi:23S rRNA pseudouridine2605 synthase